MNREPNEKIRELMRALPEDEPSMVWRSALDEKVRAASRKRARISLAFRWVPAGLAAAACASVAMVAIRPTTPPARPGLSPGFEAALLTTHEEVVAAPSSLDPSEDALANAVSAPSEFDASGF